MSQPESPLSLRGETRFGVGVCWLSPQLRFAFSLRSPFSGRRGDHRLRVKATLAWQGGQTEVVRQIEWTSIGGREDLTDNGLSYSGLRCTYRNGVVVDTDKK